MNIHPASLPDFLPVALAAALAGGHRIETLHEGVRTVWHVWGASDGPAVVLLHGGSGSWTHWVRNIAPLRDAGWRVLVPDLMWAPSRLVARLLAPPDLHLLSVSRT